MAKEKLPLKPGPKPMADKTEDFYCRLPTWLIKKMRIHAFETGLNGVSAVIRDTCLKKFKPTKKKKRKKKKKKLAN